MSNHYSYSKDRDLMMEAYASVSGNVPATASTAMPRLLNERAGTPKVGSEFDGGTVIDIGAEEDGVIEIAVEKGDKLEMLYYNTATGEATPAEDAEQFNFASGETTEDVPVDVRDEVAAKVLEIAGKPLGDLTMSEYEAAQHKALEIYKGEGKEHHVKELEQSLSFLKGAQETLSNALDKATAEDAEGFDMLDVHHFVDQNDITAAIKEFGTEAIKQYIDFMDEQMDAAPEDGE